MLYAANTVHEMKMINKINTLQGFYHRTFINRLYNNMSFSIKV